MSVEQSNTIDFISTSQNGVTYLTISDHLEWDKDNEHLLILQEKLSAYLEFIESGEIWEQYPGAIGRRIGIEIIFTDKPINDAIEFLNRAGESIRNEYGYEFKYRVL